MGMVMKWVLSFGVTCTFFAIFAVNLRENNRLEHQLKLVELRLSKLEVKEDSPLANLPPVRQISQSSRLNTQNVEDNTHSVLPSGISTKPEVSNPDLSRGLEAADVNHAYENLDQRIEETPPDPQWRPEQEIQNTLRDVRGLRLGKTRCSVDACRVEVTHDDVNKQQDLASQISKFPVFANGTLYRYEVTPTGVPLTVIYVSRPEHTLHTEDES
jgi:hypothetical protein